MLIAGCLPVLKGIWHFSSSYYRLLHPLSYCPGRQWTRQKLTAPEIKTWIWERFLIILNPIKYVAIKIQKPSTQSSANSFTHVQSIPQKRLKDNVSISHCPPDNDTQVSTGLKLRSYTSKFMGTDFFSQSVIHVSLCLCLRPLKHIAKQKMSGVRGGWGVSTKCDSQ